MPALLRSPHRMSASASVATTSTGTSASMTTGQPPQELHLGRAFAVRQLPVRPREVAVVAVGVALQVVLVLGLGLPEGDGLADRGDDLAGPDARGVDVGDRVLGDPALLVAGVEDLRAVGRADVVALTVLGRRVVYLEEELQDVAVGDPRGIEDDLDGLGVAGMVAVGRVLVLAAGVADTGGDHPVAPAKQLLDPPETAPGEDRCLGGMRHGCPLSGRLAEGQDVRSHARSLEHDLERARKRAALRFTLDSHVARTSGSRRTRAATWSWRSASRPPQSEGSCPAS